MEEHELIPERISVTDAQRRELLRIIDWPDNAPTPKLDALKNRKTPWTE
jgi:uncharacterized protein (DUF1778 family)